jgi:hypothetical protein
VNVYDAMANLMESTHVPPFFVSQFSPKEAILGETGGSSDPTGTFYGASVPSALNEYVYLTNLTTTLNKAEYSAFYCEAFPAPSMVTRSEHSTRERHRSAGSAKRFAAAVGV